MFGSSSIGDAVNRLSRAQDQQSFESALSTLRSCMKNLGMDCKYLIELEKRAYYLPNEYSDKDTKEKMNAAKDYIRRENELPLYLPPKAAGVISRLI